MMDYIKSGGCYEPLVPPEDSSLSSLSEDVAFADITKETPEEFAKQITLIELSFFKAIKREEFTSLKWNGREKHLYAPNIVASTRWFNQINFWVQKEILKYSCVSKRTELLAFFIKIAKKLVDFNNLYSAMSIVSALQVECIYRLRHTWAGLGNKDRATYRRLEELFSQDDNCRRQREHMSSISLPGIPYLGLYLSDLTYTNVAQPRVNGKPTPTWYAKINAIVETIAYFQQSKYNFVVDETINVYLCAQRYIEELQKFLEEDNYKTSLALEPPPAPPPLAPPQPVLAPPASLCLSPGEKHYKFGRDSLKFGHDNSPATEISTNTSSGFGFGFRSPSKLSSIHLPGTGGKTHQRNHSTASLTTAKAASINSSFEADFVPHSKLLCPTGSGGEPSFSTTSMKIPAACPKTAAQFDLPSNDELRSPPLKPDTSADNLWKLGKVDDLVQRTGEVDSVAKPPPLVAQGSPGFDELKKPSIDLPPIPPRPLPDSQPKTTQLNSPNHATDSSQPTSNCPPPLVVDKYTGHTLPSRLSHSMRETPAKLADLSDSHDANTPTITSTTTTTTSSGLLDLTPKLNSLNMMDSSAAAACAAVVAANLVDPSFLPTQPTSPSKHQGHDSSYTVDPKLLANQSFEALATSTPPRSPISTEIPPPTDPASMTSSFCRTQTVTPDPRSLQFGVRVICQGVVQRRTIARQSSKHQNPDLAALNLKRCSSPLTLSTVYASTSSLSTCSAAGTNHRPSIASPSRPASFSKWRRLWATLVLVGEGFAAYIIYFEPKTRNATQRDEFQAHQCQIHCLARLPFQLSNMTHLEDIEQEDEDPNTHHADESKEIDVAEGSDLLDDPLVEKSRSCSSSTLSSSKWKTKATRDLSVPCISLGSLAQIEPGRHRDGSLDPTSFFLTDPVQGKTYRFRPVAIHPSKSHNKSLNRHDPLRSTSSALNWFRRGPQSPGFQSPRIFPRTSQLVDPSPTSPCLGRARGQSAPGLFTHPGTSCSFGETPSTDQKSLPHMTEQDQVNQWLIAIQTTLAKLKEMQRRQFAAYYASRCVSLNRSADLV